MTKHPSEAVLALVAGGDLGTWQRWRVERHVASCAACRQEVAEFSELREAVPGMIEPPEISWTKLAVEMKANIRLGLEAGECVSAGRTEGRGIFSMRALAVCGSLALLLAAFLLERPVPRVEILKASEAAFMESSGAGIQVKTGDQSIMMLNTRARDAHNVDYLASGNAMRARYVDTETGYVTINNVYAQ
jgi:anti-sigma factor RsiW